MFSECSLLETACSFTNTISSVSEDVNNFFVVLDFFCFLQVIFFCLFMLVSVFHIKGFLHISDDFVYVLILEYGTKGSLETVKWE